MRSCCHPTSLHTVWLSVLYLYFYESSPAPERELSNIPQYASDRRPTEALPKPSYGIKAFVYHSVIMTLPGFGIGGLATSLEHSARLPRSNGFLQLLLQNFPDQRFRTSGWVSLVLIICGIKNFIEVMLYLDDY